jgi:archaetidylinositol phosphate synthase
MGPSQFAGDRKQGEWIFARAERRMVGWLVPRVPRFLQTYHLTMMTLLWSGGIVVCSLLARQSVHWLWGVSLFIALQYLSDVLDGAVGRYRDTGLVKWGYYMDHFLDYVFLAAILAGYALFLTNVHWFWFLGLLALGGAFMVNMFLSFAATNEFRISVLRVGPTEIRLFFILLNTAFILLGTGIAEVLVPVMVGFLGLVLVWVVFRTQKQIWGMDMAHKRSSSGV